MTLINPNGTATRQDLIRLFYALADLIGPKKLDEDTIAAAVDKFAERLNINPPVESMGK